MLDKLKTLTARAAEVKANFISEAKELIGPAITALFKDHPEIKALKWTQYTPYFNDGEPCVFSVSGVYASTAADVSSDDDADDDDRWCYAYRHDKTVPEGFTKAGWKAFCSLAETIEANESADVLEAAFGDHVSVFANSAGIEVEEYDHD